MVIALPDSVSKIINMLVDSGHEAYAVGGCVRDSILGLIPHDWDICTSAKPNEVLSIFKNYRVIETGVKHGTVTVVIDNVGYEITTYRIDGNYSDNRHPDTVSFTRNLIQDLGRRDFSMNSMAYNEKVGLVDPFGGAKDLENHVLKCVGIPDDRFKEDALRIIRALRFAANYDLDIEYFTSKSLVKNKHLIKNVAEERINSEFCKLLGGKGAANVLLQYKEIIGQIIPEITPCFDFNQNNKWHSYDVYTHMVKATDHYNKTHDDTDFIVTLALFLHDIGKPACCISDDNGSHFPEHGKIGREIVERTLNRMRFDSKTVRDVSELVFYHDATIESSKSSVKRWLNKMGEKQFGRLLEMRTSDIAAHLSPTALNELNEEMKEKIRCKDVKKSKTEELFKEVISEKECFTIKNLAVNGFDIISLGIAEGPEIGRILNMLLDAVIEGQSENTKDSLIERCILLKS